MRLRLSRSADHSDARSAPGRASVERRRRRQRGTAVVEYIVLIGTITTSTVVMAEELGAVTSDEVQAGQTAQRAEEQADRQAAVIAPCLDGWNLFRHDPLAADADGQAQAIDRNGDGLVCREGVGHSEGRIVDNNGRDPG